MTSPEAEPRRRQPLLLVVLGLVIIQLRVEANGFDALPDPVGWLVIAFACRALPQDVPRRGAILGAAVIAALTSIALWPTDWNDRVVDLEESLLWAITLPGLGWSVLFCLAMAFLAQPQPVSSLLWQYLAFGFVATAALPVIVFGGEAEWLESTWASISAFSQLALFVLALLHAWRPWAAFARDPE